MDSYTKFNPPHSLPTAGIKHYENKRRLDLVPISPLLDWAEVLTMGAKKYADRNWEKGLIWSRCYADALRHLTSWWDGEDTDPESGLSHLAHVMCNISFLLEFTHTHPELDNRPTTTRDRTNP